MNERHLSDEELAEAVVGRLLDEDAHAHLAHCLSCRRRVEVWRSAVSIRRAGMLDMAPDWAVQRGQIMARLDAPEASVVPLYRRPLARALLAAAAVLIVAVGLWLHLARRSPAVPATDAQVEHVLDQVNATLADDGVPGFEPLDQLVPSPGELSKLRTAPKTQG